MKKNRIVNALLMAIFLMHVRYLFGMDKYCARSIDNMVSGKYKAEAYQKYIENSAQATTYNCNHYFLSVPDEVLVQIFSKIITESLEDIIKNFLRFSTTCKRINSLLTVQRVGAACKGYDFDQKNKTLEKLMRSANDYTHSFRRRAALMLVYAGSDGIGDRHYSLLQRAVHYKDIPMIAALFENHVDPNEKDLRGPILFDVSTVQIAKMFIAQGADVHVLKRGNNILCEIISDDEKPSDLIKLYLTCNVNVQEKNAHTGFCILHMLGRFNYCFMYDVDNFLKKAQILLNAIPGMVNALDKEGKTPIDIACESMNKASKTTYEAYKALIELFRQYGGKTSQELAEEHGLAIQLFHQFRNF